MRQSVLAGNCHTMTQHDNIHTSYITMTAQDYDTMTPWQPLTLHLNWVPRMLELRMALKAAPLLDQCAGSAEMRYWGWEFNQMLQLTVSWQTLRWSCCSLFSSWRPAGTPSARHLAPCAGKMSGTNLTIGEKILTEYSLSHEGFHKKLGYCYAL